MGSIRVIGAIAGDMAGSTRETVRLKVKDFPLFTAFSLYTDDTVLTIAVADAILGGQSYGDRIKSWARRHPFRGYGPLFTAWMLSPFSSSYHSFGNGSAMRVSPVGFAFQTEAEVLEQARRSAACTHDHPEGIKGAQAVALAIWLARQGVDKQGIRDRMSAQFHYDMSRRLEDIRPDYRFDATCQGSVPEAILAFLESTDFEDAIRNAISLGGDSDTQAAIAGSIAEAYYGFPPEGIVEQVHRRLSRPMIDTLTSFYARFLGRDPFARVRLGDAAGRVP